MPYDNDDTRCWFKSRNSEALDEILAPGDANDLGDARYDELMRRQLITPIVDVISDAIDETFGSHIAEAHTTHNELHELAAELSDVLTNSELWTKIRGRIKRLAKSSEQD